jgi:LTXXQ motif family protein
MVTRLGAVDLRLAAMLQAAKTLRPALDNFYAALNDEQKARFNTMGQSRSQSARGG